MTLNSNIQDFWSKCKAERIGHMSVMQAEFIIDQLKDIRLNNVLEIGFAGGRHTYAMLKTFDVKKWVTIDINYDYQNSRHKIDEIKKEFDNIEFIEGDSKTVLTNDFMKTKFPEGVDYVLVDGGHDYNTAFLDMQNVFNHIISGGIMIVDDYKSKVCPIAQVDKAVESFSKNTKASFEGAFLEDGKGMAVFKKS